MRMLSAVVLSLLLLQGSPHAGERPIVAVFDMEDKGSGLAAKSLSNLTEYLAARLTEEGYQVIPRDEIRKRLKEQKSESYKECYDQSCQIELGRELAAGKTLSPRILKIGTTCQVTAVLYDLKKAATDQAATAEAECSEDSLLKAVQDIASRLSVKTPVVSAAAMGKESSTWWLELEVHGCLGGGEGFDDFEWELADGHVGRRHSSRWGGGVSFGVGFAKYHLVYLQLDFMTETWTESTTGKDLFFGPFRLLLAYRFAYPVLEWLQPFISVGGSANGYYVNDKETVPGYSLDPGFHPAINLALGVRCPFHRQFFATVSFLFDLAYWGGEWEGLGAGTHSWIVGAGMTF